jgi:5'-deoxynucleotidase YfbR-like HD superfamily hydrolase
MVRPCLALQGLLHDAQEAYVGDMPTPMKKYMPEFQIIEKRNWVAVASRFDLPFFLSSEVHAADKILYWDEVYALGLSDEAPAVSQAFIQCLSPKDAEALFLARFKELNQ